MQALVLHAVGDLRLESVPKPAAAAGQVLVRIGYCGVCGSDIPRIFTKGTYKFPTICGHEFAGSVEAVGSEVSDLKPGDAVAVFPLLWCGKCPACAAGKYVQCENYDYYGSRRDGAFAEYVAVPRKNVLKVPAGVSAEEAAMTEPAAVGLHALRRAGASKGSLAGQTVAVFGAGPIGLMVCQWARAFGAERVLTFDIVPEKLELARKMHAEAFDSRKDDPVKTVERLTGGRGAHLSLDAAGVPATLLAAFAATRAGGTAVILGNPSKDVTIPMALISQLMRREVTMVGTWNSDYSDTGQSDDWHAALAAMADKTIDVRPLISHKVSLAEASKVLADMRDQKGFFCKVLVKPEESGERRSEI